MKGSYKLTVQAAHMKYELELSRNITILRGDSATGKTVLVEMIQEYNLNGSDTGIQLSCEKPCRVIAGNTWKEQLVHIEESIVFIDEGNRFVSSEDFVRIWIIFLIASLKYMEFTVLESIILQSPYIIICIGYIRLTC